MPKKDISIALTIGDPAGIGPELAASKLESGSLDGRGVVLIGSAAALKRTMGAENVDRWETIPAGEPMEKLPERLPAIIDVAGGEDVPTGGPSAAGGRISARAIEIAADLAKRGLVDGIVTGPISKEALAMAGYPYKGHTSMFGYLLSAPDCQMMMVSGDFRVVILTRDIALKDVPDAVTRERIMTGVRVTAEALKEFWGIEEPSIMVAALNPHGGDGGINGTEEITTIAPALSSLRYEGLNVTGPVPADTMFQKWHDKKCDAFIALYHDQGMIPFKFGGFDQGVNMTIGLPVVRTSVCHGTAYDIAGRGTAGTGSLSAALDLAEGCARARRNRENPKKKAGA